MPKRINHIEDDEQAALFHILTIRYPDIRKVTFAIPNGGKRNIREAARLKAQGVTPGVPDIFCAHSSKTHNGLFIEMKRPIVKGKPKPVISPEQREMIITLLGQGYWVHVCYGATEALKVILEYWNLPTE
jgi:hypothetical protein